VVRVLLCAAAFGSPVQARAQLLDLSDATVARAGRLEVELQPVGSQTTWEAGDRTDEIVATVNTVFGIGGGWDVTYTGRGPVEIGAPESAVLDASLLARVMIVEGGYSLGEGDLDRPSVALQWGAYLPVVGGDPTFAPSIGVLLSQMIGPWSVHLHLELILSRERRARLFTVGQVLGPEAWPVRPVLEGWVDHDSARTLGSVLVGAIVPAGDALALQPGLRLGLGDEAVQLEGRLVLLMRLDWAPTAWRRI